MELAKGYVAMTLVGASEGFINLLADGDKARPFYAYLTKEDALSLARQLVQAAAEAQQLVEAIAEAQQAEETKG